MLRQWDTLFPLAFSCMRFSRMSRECWNRRGSFFYAWQQPLTGYRAENMRASASCMWRGRVCAYVNVRVVDIFPPWLQQVIFFFLTLRMLRGRADEKGGDKGRESEVPPLSKSIFPRMDSLLRPSGFVLLSAPFCVCLFVCVFTRVFMCVCQVACQWF